MSDSSQLTGSGAPPPGGGAGAAHSRAGGVADKSSECRLTIGGKKVEIRDVWAGE